MKTCTVDENENKIFAFNISSDFWWEMKTDTITLNEILRDLLKELIHSVLAHVICYGK